MYAQDNNEIFAWLRGGDSTPDPEMENRFLDIIAERVMVKMGVKLSDEEAARRAEAERRRQRRSRMTESPISIKTIMKQIREEEAQAQPALPSEESLPWENEAKPAAVPDSLDSVLVAKALQWMASTHEVSLNISQIQTILYNAYGVYLATKGERLLSEHPQVWQYGPVFPRAYKHLKKNSGNGQVEHDMLRNDSPDRYEFIRRCFMRFAWTSAGSLNAPHIAQDSPWKKTKDSNSDKLGVRIEDELIRQWFLPRV
ncbi:MAG: DUF4065 domain-containing protein [Bacteroidales bacterium]|nr:DUF4065 domain-containing protein [Bacteroidales bacterium]MBQ8049453.1 DUF4065 domain-containing protein [Bacteroidales bacterium]